jgi:hypothetical protein
MHGRPAGGPLSYSPSLVLKRFAMIRSRRLADRNSTVVTANIVNIRTEAVRGTAEYECRAQ